MGFLIRFLALKVSFLRISAFEYLQVYMEKVNQLQQYLKLKEKYLGNMYVQCTYILKELSLMLYSLKKQPNYILFYKYFLSFP